MDLEEFIAEWNNDSERLLVHTSGSTGKPKPMWVEKSRMAHSAHTTCAFLGLKSGDTALLCLSLDYIAGKMMAVRAIEWGLDLICSGPSGHPLSFKINGLTSRHVGELDATDTSNSSTEISFAAMTPMQVYNSLQVPDERERLMQIKHLIIGGGAIDEAVEAELRLFPNAVWSTYGMTETLSHIALRRISGSEASEWYEPFPDVSVSLSDDGCLVIDAPGVCADRLTTNDCAVIHDDSRRFRIIGRKDNVINSGGVKIHAEEVEQLLSSYMRVPYIICKDNDAKFGEVVVLVYESSVSDITSENGYLVSADDIQGICRSVLPKYWQPRRFIAVQQIEMTETGKPRRNISLYKK